MNPQIRFGKPNSYDYNTILDQFSGTKINSIRTSSIPLAQFWKNAEIKLTKLFETLDLDFKNPHLCFEYPTTSKGQGKSSMTDLMILAGDYKIAIEAKFTEYLEKNNGIVKISEWRNEKNQENRKIVLNHWTKLINEFSNLVNDETNSEIDYQFYHRTASACFESKKAIVLYQLFYEIEKKNELDTYIESLKKYVKLIDPNDKLSFYIWIVETKLINNEEYTIDPFGKMKFQDIYMNSKMMT